MDFSESSGCGTEFTLAEILEMVNIFKETGKKTPSPEACQRIASSFNSSPARTANLAIPWEQVQTWFRYRQRKEDDEHKDSKINLGLFFDLSDVDIPELGPKSPMRKGVKASEISEMLFEAKSAKDNAWYDVAAFLTFRVMYTGELEVRARFSGFCHHSQDEWVNLKKAVRERSIPVEPSECQMVKVGDLVLCFQERPEHAVYCDAYVLVIERHSHDAQGCNCSFTVRYDNDCTIGKVQLGWICRRPT